MNRGAALALTLFVALAFGCAAPAGNNNAAWTPPKDDPPLSPAQDKWIMEVLAASDKIDALYKRGVKDGRRYYDAGLKVEDKYFENRHLISDQDYRAVILANTVKAYQEACTLIISNEGRRDENTDAAALKVSINKGLLLSIKKGNLTPEVKKLLDDLRRQWRK